MGGEILKEGRCARRLCSARERAGDENSRCRGEREREREREREKETERGKGGVSGVGESEEKQAADQVAGWVA